MEQRRLLTFLVLSILSIYLYFNVLTRVYGPPVPETSPVAHDVAARPEPVTKLPDTPPTSGLTARQEAAPLPMPEGRSVVIENDVLRSVWTSVGARLQSVKLKRYRTDVAADSPPLELIDHASVATLPGELETLPGGIRDTRVDYSFDKATLHVTGTDRGRIIFRGRGPHGIRLEKEIGVEGDSYVLGLTVRAHGDGAHAVSAVRVNLTKSMVGQAGSSGGWFSGAGSSRKFHGVLVLNGRHLEQVSFESLRRKPLVFDEARWGGFGDQYFIEVLLSGGVPAAKVLIPRLEAAGPAAVAMEVPLAPDTGEATLGVYFGPKDVDVLERSGGGLKRAIDFGMFWFIAAPLLQLLKLVHRVTGNYGFDIIIVSVLIKLAFLPLTQKSMVSMQAMQKLQPQMAKLKERYKGNAQEMQKQMAELYRRHHVNPISGCLPMLLQFPVFIGLYNTLRNAIELRHAPFLFWVTDLSAPERMMIGGVGVPVLAAIMGVSMLVQQWMTPSTGDSTQRMMMMLMPVVFTFMFINFPSGLVLYWLVNNVLTILQQYFLVNRPTGHTGGN